MNRGLTFLVLQAAVGTAIVALGIWSLLRPRHFQQFLNDNFALLPAASPRSMAVPALLRVLGAALIVHGCNLLFAFQAELGWLGHMFGIIGR